MDAPACDKSGHFVLRILLSLSYFFCRILFFMSVSIRLLEIKYYLCSMQTGKVIFLYASILSETFKIINIIPIRMIACESDCPFFVSSFLHL